MQAEEEITDKQKRLKMFVAYQGYCIAVSARAVFLNMHGKDADTSTYDFMIEEAKKRADESEREFLTYSQTESPD